MKYIQLKVEDELHKEIKLKAIEAGKSMHSYIIDCIIWPPVVSNRIPPLQPSKETKKVVTSGNKVFVDGQMVKEYAKKPPRQKCLFPKKATGHTCK